MRIVTILTAAGLLAACVGTGPQASRQQPATYEATRVALGDCAFGGAQGEALPAALLAAVIPTLIQQGVSLVGSALKAAGETQTAMSEAAFANLALRSGRGLPACLQVVRGRFLASRGDTPAVTPAWAATMDIDGTSLQALQLSAIHLADPPDFMFEGTFARLEGTNAYSIVPRYVALNEPLRSGLLDLGRQRGVLVTLDFFGGDFRANAQPLASVALPLGGLNAGQVLCLDPISGPARDPATRLCRSVLPSGAIQGTTTTPAPGAAPTPVNPLADPNAQNSSGSGDGTGAASSRIWSAPSRPFESTWFTLTPNSDPAPLSARIVVTETRAGSEFAAFLSRVFDGAKDQVQTVLTDVALTAASRERQEAAARERAQARNTANTAFAAERQKALQALDACAQADPANALALFNFAVTARNEQMRVNDLAALAERPAPFGALVPESGTAATRDACLAARNTAIRT